MTLWLNPGRIKRDLIPNQEEGPPLLPGHTYEILVRPVWQDATGDSIATTFQKKFVTIARDTLSPDINDWTIQAPKEGTLDPLIVHSQEPLDYGVWRNALFVLDKDAHKQGGAVEILDNDRTWRFTPYTKWKKGTYEIVVEPRVEDMAGNNLERLFDRDLQKPSAVQEGVVYPKNYVKYFEVR